MWYKDLTNDPLTFEKMRKKNGPEETTEKIMTNNVLELKREFSL